MRTTNTIAVNGMTAVDPSVAAVTMDLLVVDSKKLLLRSSAACC